MAFTQPQTRKLKAKLKPEHIRTRESQGRTLSYIEGWHSIAEANRIFGHDGWDRETLTLECLRVREHQGQFVCVYRARVRICVRAGERLITREGSGTGEGKAASLGEAHDSGLKTAETDATKRALATFGNPFGLALYDKDQSGVQRTHPWMLRSDKGVFIKRCTGPQAFAAALKTAMNRAGDIETLFALWEHNVTGVRALKAARKAKGDSLGAALVRAFRARASRLVQPDQTAPEQANGHAVSETHNGEAVLVPKSRRLRSKEHLAHVARQPCLVCGRTPSQAHHLRFAQPKGLGMKVSDEFTVPLCATHHHALHQVGDERQWWKKQGIDPLPVAARLWRESVLRRAVQSAAE